MDRGSDYTVVILVAIVAFLLFTLVVPNFTYSTSKTPSNRVRCANNLKNIGLALWTYADENDEMYPEPGTGPNQGFNILVTEDYLTTEKTYICPNTSKVITTGTGTLTTTTPNIERCYRYLPGSTWNESDFNAETGLGRDRRGNHKEFGNILFGDGHVKGYTGKTWWNDPEVEWNK